MKTIRLKWFPKIIDFLNKTNKNQLAISDSANLLSNSKIAARNNCNFQENVAKTSDFIHLLMRTLNFKIRTCISLANIFQSHILA